MSISSPPEEDEVYTFERTFTKEDVRQFGEVSGDQQAIHTDPDDEGRLVVQGLLTATLPTKIGGDLSYIARTMEFEFRKPVYTGNTITCEWTNESVEERADRYTVTSLVVCTNDDGETVMEASIDGLIWKED
ncbi:MaoC/PaaZ C-terminal domain-containing protein [Halobacterium sp. KA-6]|uniref:MaoC/PaaZ C-terminal domain-containing protein n=1 Tax=Halobacterium sp. KA-6 TaxID=2896368 RepID=UPI001E4DC856|nr:MaoC/PaaZ C-terminal domain-containing protein [Halobacterium sp. KA-6]MCD2203767.1 dehydratase [Halobacterium sp. KA-6]